MRDRLAQMRAALVAYGLALRYGGSVLSSRALRLGGSSILRAWRSVLQIWLLRGRLRSGLDYFLTLLVAHHIKYARLSGPAS